MCENLVSEGMYVRARISSVLMPAERIRVLISEICNGFTVGISDTYLAIRPWDSRDRIAIAEARKFICRIIVSKSLFQKDCHCAT